MNVVIEWKEVVSDMKLILRKYRWNIHEGFLLFSILKTNIGPFFLEGLLPVGCEERAGGNLSQENHHHYHHYHHQYLQNPNHHHRHHHHHLCRQGAEDSQRPRLWGNGHRSIATCALFVRFSHYLILCTGRVISKFEFRESSIIERRARDLLLETR